MKRATKTLIFLRRKAFLFPGRIILLLELALSFFLFLLFLCQLFLAFFK